MPVTQNENPIMTHEKQSIAIFGQLLNLNLKQ